MPTGGDCFRLAVPTKYTGSPSNCVCWLGSVHVDAGATPCKAIRMIRVIAEEQAEAFGILRSQQSRAHSVLEALATL